MEERRLNLMMCKIGDGGYGEEVGKCRVRFIRNKQEYGFSILKTLLEMLP